MLNKFKFFVAQSWLLIVASFTFGLLIAVANAAWSPRIEMNRVNKLNNLMKSVLPVAADFKPALSKELIAVGNKKYETNISRAVDASGNTIGWAFIVTGSGFADRIELVVGVDAKFENMTGYDVLYANETPGFGDKIKGNFFKKQFEGIPAGTLTLVKSGKADIKDDTIVAITGATVTSEAVVKTLSEHLNQVRSALRSKGFIDAK